MKLIVALVVIILGCALVYAVHEIPKHYYHYKEELLKADLKIQIEIEHTEQEQVRLAKKIAKKEIEAEKTKQLQIKANLKSKS